MNVAFAKASKQFGANTALTPYLQPHSSKQSKKDKFATIANLHFGHFGRFGQSAVKHLATVATGHGDLQTGDGRQKRQFGAFAFPSQFGTAQANARRSSTQTPQNARHRAFCFIIPIRCSTHLPRRSATRRKQWLFYVHRICAPACSSFMAG